MEGSSLSWKWSGKVPLARWYLIKDLKTGRSHAALWIERLGRAKTQVGSLLGMLDEKEGGRHGWSLRNIGESGRT